MSDVSGERIEDLSIIEEMQDSYLTYAMSVIMSRALPDVRDGLKPSQRRILVAMNDLNLGPRAQHRKCAKIAGDTSGNYHPHGEQVIYPTLVRLAQHWNMRQTLIDGQGNFGSMDGDPPAAMRYTEARMTSAATEMLADLQFDTVDFEPNYDGTRTEPTVLPSKFPHLLVNGSVGIAVGMATNLPPHNLAEICDGIVAVMDNPDITLPELLEIVPGPDFPTGGFICGRQGIVNAYSTGRGSITLRGRFKVVEGRGGKETLIIYELPYGVLRSTLVEKVAAAVKSGHIKEIAAVNDASDRNHPVRIEIDLKKDANQDVVVNQLYKYTPLQNNISIINIALVNRQPKTLPLKAMLSHYVDHRRIVIRRRTRHLLRKARQKAHVLEGLILAVGDIDAIIQLIKDSPDPPTAKQRLMDRALQLTEDLTLRQLLPDVFVKKAAGSDQNLTAVQADAILSMQLQRLTGLEINKLAEDYGKLVEEISGYEIILGDEQRVLDIIREDVYELKEKYGNARRTEIIQEVGDFAIEELIPDTQVVVTISHQGYIKRVDAGTYRKQGRGGRGIRGGDTKEGDFLDDLFVVSTHDYLLFFSDRGRIYWSRVFDLPAQARTSRGRSIANLLKMQANETLCTVLPVKVFEEKYVFFSTAKGIVKKTPMVAYSRPRPSGIIAITLDPDDTLIGVSETSGEDEIVLGSRNGMAIRFNEGNVRAMGRNARGVRGMNLDKGDEVVDMIAIQPGQSVLTICENGYGKRTDIGEYRLTNRGAKGVINIKTSDRNGKVVAIKAVGDEDEVMIITAKGIMLRTDLTRIREIGRATQGVKIIKPDAGDRVVAVAKIANEEVDEDSEAASPEATDSIDESPDSQASDDDTSPSASS